MILMIFYTLIPLLYPTISKTQEIVGYYTIRKKEICVSYHENHLLFFPMRCNINACLPGYPCN